MTTHPQLHLACILPGPELLEAILANASAVADEGARASGATDPPDVMHGDAMGRSPLHLAVLAQNRSEVRLAPPLCWSVAPNSPRETTTKAADCSDGLCREATPCLSFSSYPSLVISNTCSCRSSI